MQESLDTGVAARKDGTASYFDAAAHKFDEFYREESKGWLRRFIDSTLRKSMRERYERTFQVLSPLQGKSVLDIGCGSGRYSVTCAELGAERVVGIDFARSMIDIARRIASESGHAGTVEFVEADYLTYSCHDKFDAAIVMGVFDYVLNPVAFLSKIVTDVRGTVVASFPVRYDLWMLQRKLRYLVVKRCPLYFYSSRRIRRILSQAGIVDYEIEKLHRDYVVHFQTLCQTR